MSYVDKNKEIYETINDSLNETVMLAQEVTHTISTQGEVINKSHQELKGIDEYTKVSYKTVKIMNSTIYRWWMWISEMGNNVTNHISTHINSHIPNVFNNTLDNDNDTVVNIDKKEANNTYTNSSSSSKNDNTIINIDYLETLKEISITIGDELDKQCLQYHDIQNMTDKIETRISKTNKISKKMC